MLNDEMTVSIDQPVKPVINNVRAQLAKFSTGAALAWAELRLVASRAALLLCLLLLVVGMVLVTWVLILITSVPVLSHYGFSIICSFLGVPALQMTRARLKGSAW